MNKLRINFFYGLVALLPIAILGLIGYYLYSFWTLVFLPLSDQLGLSTFELRVIAVILAIPAFILLCIGIGWAIRTRLGTVSFEFVENSILRRMPGYDIISNLLRGFAERESRYPAALVRLNSDGVDTPAFVMEHAESPRVTVFVPFAPLMTMGQVYVVDRDRVSIIPNATVGAANHISQWGIGFQDMADAAERESAGDGRHTSASRGTVEDHRHSD